MVNPYVYNIWKQAFQFEKSFWNIQLQVLWPKVILVNLLFDMKSFYFTDVVILIICINLETRELNFSLFGGFYSTKCSSYLNYYLMDEKFC